MRPPFDFEFAPHPDPRPERVFGADGRARAGRFALCLLPILLWAGERSPGEEPAAAAPVSFAREIRPILSDKCFHCHGPDAETRKARLRLDEREAALALLAPGDADGSELLARVASSHPDEAMPPPSEKKPLTAEEVELLRRWIEQGAPYEAHWAFLPVSRPDPPAVETSDFVKNPIDRFVVNELEKQGIPPSPEAEAPTLLRRLHLDLTGLLPSPERVGSFIAEYRADPDAAVAAEVDRLLDSPHHGERWGRHWLDQARYADSNGYSIDGERSMWPYRDWVIRAINDDLPFDRFTIEQLAGDLLPEPTKAQLVATGFHRNTLINQEGGTDREQFRNEAVVDRVNTTGAVWMGLTLGCAQCHTHKYDPVTHREYFELFAFFNHGSDVNAAGSTVEVFEGELLLDSPDPAQLAALEEARGELASLERSKPTRQEAWEESAAAMLRAGSAGTAWTPLRARALAAREAALSRLDDGSILASPGHGNEVYTLELEAPGHPLAALRLRVLPHESLPRKGPGLAANGNFVLTRLELSQDGRRIPFGTAGHSHSQPGFDSNHLIDDDPGTGWAINLGSASRPGLVMNAAHEAHFVLAEPLAPGGGPLELVLRHERNQHYNLGRFALEGSASVPPSPSSDRLLAILETPAAERNDEEKRELADAFDRADEALRTARSRLALVRRELGLGAPAPTMVMRELPEPRETHVHLRGDFLSLDTGTGPLSPGVPAVLPPLEEKEGGAYDRLDLARWLVRPDHPLTARVTVNRVWMRYFGQGIVGTENDFGLQSTYPTHPELLDWLAAWFVEEAGWSMKELHRLIATSAVYRQASRVRDELAETDPLNRLLARQARLRVEAEIVRDAALSASGLLHPRIGGPPVTPPQPEGVYAFTQRRVTWTDAEGPDRYRRALYTRFYRSAPYPMLTTFDSPDFQSVCTARVRSNTPLQALTLANDAALHELAQGLAARLLREVGGHDSEAARERADLAFLVCYARPPSESEREQVVAFQEAQAGAYRQDAGAALAMAPGAELAELAGWDPEGTDPALAASWVAVARALMNTDEFITRE